MTFDVTSGNKNSQITAGTFSYTALNATSSVDYIQKSSGSALTVGATSVSGYITIDNTYGVQVQVVRL